LFAGEFGPLKLEGLGEGLAQSLGEIGHFIPGCGAAIVKPFEELADAISGLLPEGKLRLKLVAGHGTDVNLHARNLQQVAASAIAIGGHKRR
jgi:hypothetical protein